MRFISKRECKSFHAVPSPASRTVPFSTRWPDPGQRRAFRLEHSSSPTAHVATFLNAWVDRLTSSVVKARSSQESSWFIPRRSQGSGGVAEERRPLIMQRGAVPSVSPMKLGPATPAPLRMFIGGREQKTTTNRSLKGETTPHLLVRDNLLPA